MIEHPDIDSSSRIRIISDIHLGHKKSSIKATTDLTPLIEGCDTLIALGDSAETRIGKYKESGLQGRQELIELCQSLGRKLILIGGNHDPDVPARGLFLQNNLIFMMHGDSLFKTGAPWGREYLQNKKIIKDIIRKYPEAGKTLHDRLTMSKEVAEAIPAILSKESGYGKLIDFFLHAAWPPTRPIRILGSWYLYKHMVRKFARKYVPQSKIIITGHMHRRTLFMADNRLFINTGAFFSHATPWIVDIHEHNLTVSNISPKLTPTHSVASYSLN